MAKKRKRRNSVTEEQAKYILDMRLARRLRVIFKEG